MAGEVINPRVIVANGVAVTDAAPLPCTSVDTTVTDNGAVINPVTWVANSIAVTDTDPLPITLV